VDGDTVVDCADTCLDADGDGYGSAGGAGNTCSGTDCDDADADNWDACAACLDTDLDSYYVGCNAYTTRNGPDCDDSSATAADTFPGAAPNDSGSACMKDSDGDDYGDLTPPAGVTLGTDCDDTNASINPGALNC
jgi:hypothetical protein